MPRTTRPIVQLQGTSCTAGLLYGRQYNLKGFSLFWQNLKWQKISIYKFNFLLPFDNRNIFCHFLSLKFVKRIGDNHCRREFKWQKNDICKVIVFANSNFGIILKITSGFWSVLHIHVYFECFSLPTLDFQIYVYYNLYIR